MYLFEFTEPDPHIIQLVAIVNHLKDMIDNGQVDDDWTVDRLLRYFQKNGLNFDESDLENMIQNPPLSKVISSLDGDKVIFNTGSDDMTPDPDFGDGTEEMNDIPPQTTDQTTDQTDMGQDNQDNEFDDTEQEPVNPRYSNKDRSIVKRMADFAKKY